MPSQSIMLTFQSNERTAILFIFSRCETLFFSVCCRQNFNSMSQWPNHERSSKKDFFQWRFNLQVSSSNYIINSIMIGNLQWLVSKSVSKVLLNQMIMMSWKHLIFYMKFCWKPTCNMRIYALFLWWLPRDSIIFTSLYLPSITRESFGVVSSCNK